MQYTGLQFDNSKVRAMEKSLGSSVEDLKRTLEENTVLTNENIVLREVCFTLRCYSTQYIIVPTQAAKMHSNLANLNHCAVPFLSRTAVNLCWRYYTIYIMISDEYT